jgi:sugar/nucleoside kinase (ribokinase family)
MSPRSSPPSSARLSSECRGHLGRWTRDLRRSRLELAIHHELEQAVRLASAAGALACRATRARSSLPEGKELEEFVRSSVA